MAEQNVAELPVITESEFTINDRFMIVDDGKIRLLTKAVFESWVSNNLQGTQGVQGVAGRDGVNGSTGTNGTNGTNGISSYQIAVANGFIGTVDQWLASLKGSAGTEGEEGDNGWSPVLKIESSATSSYLKIIDWVGGNGVKPSLLGYISEGGVGDNVLNATNVKGGVGDRGFTGIQGERGLKGATGDRGFTGETGLSAYEQAVVAGFVGTKEEWLLSLNPSEVSEDPDNIISKKIDGMYASVNKPSDILSFISALDSAIS